MIYKGNHKLGDFFTSRRERGMPGLSMLSVTMNNGVVTRESLDRKMETNLSDEEHLLVRKDDIVYNMMRMWQGASGLADRDGLISPAYVVLAPKKGIDPIYASYLFKSSRLIYLLWAYSYGLTSDRLRLYFNDFKRIPVNIPSLPEQRKIGKILATWDKAIDVTEKLIENSKAQKRALMKELLTGRSRIAGFEEKWKKFPIKQMGKIYSGGTPDTEVSDYWDGDILWMTPTDVTSLKSRFICNTSKKITVKGLSNSSATLLPAGTLLVCTRATIGLMSISTTDISTNQGFKSLVPNSKFHVDFIYYILCFFKHKLIRYSCGSTFLELSKKDFEKLDFLCPPRFEEQQKIADILIASDDEILNLQQKLCLLKQEKMALMQQLLTSKRRVKVDES